MTSLKEFFKIRDRRSVMLATAVAVYFTAILNYQYFISSFDVIGTSWVAILRAISVSLTLLLLNIGLFVLVTPFRAFRLILILLLTLGAASAYLMDTYGLAADRNLLFSLLVYGIDLFKSWPSEGFFLYMALLAVVPAMTLTVIAEVPQSWMQRGRDHMIVAGVAFAGVIGIAVLSQGFIPAFVKKGVITSFANPIAPIYATVDLAREMLWRAPKPVMPMASDAAMKPASDRRRLAVMVVGNSVRYDRLGLNGYAKETTPHLDANGEVISFHEAIACATTFEAVPCMFSLDGASEYSWRHEGLQQNVLDVLRKVGVSVHWRDNDGATPEVASRVHFEDFTDRQINRLCDAECRDDGMLDNLDELVESAGDADVLIVLRMMGSFGPSYFRRVRPSERNVRQQCRHDWLDLCSKAEISSSYDDTIRQLDIFLGEVIDFLSQYDDERETTLFFVGDHGESLGENGTYLHGLPPLIAPREQLHVPFLIWLGSQHHEDVRRHMTIQSDYPVSHDHVSHTLMGLFGITTNSMSPPLSLFAAPRSDVAVEADEGGG